MSLKRPKSYDNVKKIIRLQFQSSSLNLFITNNGNLLWPVYSRKSKENLKVLGLGDDCSMRLILILILIPEKSVGSTELHYSAKKRKHKEGFCFFEL